MAIRRLNYTGRKKILRQHAQIVLRRMDDGETSFDAFLHLTDYKFPAGSRVFVEAYRQTSWMRFDFGAVDRLRPPDDRRLATFKSTEGLLFRIRVTSTPEGRSVLLGEGDRIPIRSPEEALDSRIPLLAVCPDQELGAEVARVDFTDEPLLLINATLDEWPSIAKSAPFVTLVYPLAFREILARILYVEEFHETDDDSKWQSIWLRFATGLVGVGDVPAKEARDAFDPWIDRAVAAFARHHSLCERFARFWNQEGKQ